MCFFSLKGLEDGYYKIDDIDFFLINFIFNREERELKRSLQGMRLSFESLGIDQLFEKRIINLYQLLGESKKKFRNKDNLLKHNNNEDILLCFYYCLLYRNNNFFNYNLNLLSYSSIF